jgi:predicted DNA-binding transcriptional regulator AlpA
VQRAGTGGTSGGGLPVGAALHLEHLPPDKLLTCEQVLSLVPLSKSAWFEGVKGGRFPKGVRLSSKSFFLASR